MNITSLHISVFSPCIIVVILVLMLLTSAWKDDDDSWPVSHDWWTSGR